MKEVKTGLSASYYTVPVTSNLVPSGSLVNPEEYMLECIDVLEALRLTYSEANVIKALWRTSSKRVLDVSKAGVTDLYDMEKVSFFCKKICKSSRYSSGVGTFPVQVSSLITIAHPECNIQPAYITCLEEAKYALRLTEDESHLLSVIWYAACKRIEAGSVLYPYTVYTKADLIVLSVVSAHLLGETQNR